jgi:hypothetical protein
MTRPHTAAETLAWLMWCYSEGYTKPEDRDILDNWMGEPAPHPDDEEERIALLGMAAEILAVMDESQLGPWPETSER